MSRAAALWLALAGLLATAGAEARVFPGVVWGGSGQADDPRRLDMHAPASPGPHPLLVVAGLEGGEALARALAERGHVVALLAPGSALQREALGQALAFLYWRGPGYGADSSRLDVLAAGAAADALLSLARDPAPLIGAGVPEGTLRALMVPSHARDGEPGAPPPALALPALLVLAEVGIEDARLDAVRLAERWRGFGAAAEAIEAPDARSGAEALAVVLRSWLPAVAMPRVPRFESLRFDAVSEELPGAGAASVLRAHRGALFLARGDETSTVWRRDAADGRWLRELSGQRGRVLQLGELGEPAARTLGLVVAADDGLSVRLRGEDGRWRAARRLADAGAAARAAWVETVAAGSTRAAALLVAIDAGARSRLFRLGPDGAVGTEVVTPGARISGMVRHFGTPMLAIHDATGGRLLRRVGDATGAWITVVAWPAARGALEGLVSLAPEADALAGLLADGTAVRLEPARGNLVVEADLRAALRRQWGGAGDAPVAWRGSMAALRHPHSGDRVHVLGIRADDPRQPPRAGWYVVRQAGGHYAYGRAGDPAADGADGEALEALLASPFVADAGATYFALSAAAVPRLRRARLPEPWATSGAWVDRAAPGSGMVLERTRAGWLVLLHRLEEGGAARWYSAGGTLDGGAFADSTGLLRYRLDEERRLQADTVGRVAIRFGAAVDDEACAGASRDGAWALAVLEAQLGDQHWEACLEPVADRERQRPAVDGSGIWMAPDGGWGMAVQSSGHGSEGSERALLLHFDHAGLPVWRVGEGERRAGTAVVALPGADGEARLAFTMRGTCGAIEASARIDLPGAAGPELPPGEVALLHSAGGACY